MYLPDKSYILRFNISTSFYLRDKPSIYVNDECYSETAFCELLTAPATKKF